MAQTFFRTAGWARAGWLLALLLGIGAAGYGARDRLAGLIPVPAAGTATPLAMRPPQPVRVTLVAFAAVKTANRFTGTIRPQHETPLAFRLPGKVLMRLVEVGDPVAPGQTVARLDDTDARLELAAARADETAAGTDLARARSDLTRAERLFAAGHVAQAALDRATSAAAEAAARRDRARQARVQAENRLSYTALVADAAGVVTATPAETGQVVQAGQPVVAIARAGALDVVFAVPEHLRGLPETARATARIWGEGGAEHALRLRDISPDADPVGRTYRVRMAMVAPDAGAALGRSVTVLLASADEAPAVALPLAAVLNEGQGAGVWRLVPGSDRVERVAVDLVQAGGAVALVRGPLAEGDQIISLGAHKIDPARPVRVVETAPLPES